MVKDKFNPKIILAGRKINDGMGKYVAKKILRKMLDNGTLDSPGDAREMIRLHKQRNPKGLFKVLQKIGLKKTYQEPDGLDYWNALFDLEIAEPAAKTVTKNIGDITDPKTGIRWVD